MPKKAPVRYPRFNRSTWAFSCSCAALGPRMGEWENASPGLEVLTRTGREGQVQ
jgi:hypothetical protein